jgi:hypothetical protein
MLDFPRGQVSPNWAWLRDSFAGNFRIISSKDFRAVTRDVGQGYRRRRNCFFNPSKEHKFPPGAVTSCHIRAGRRRRFRTLVRETRFVMLVHQTQGNRDDKATKPRQPPRGQERRNRQEAWRYARIHVSPDPWGRVRAEAFRRRKIEGSPRDRVEPSRRHPIHGFAKSAI